MQQNPNYSNVVLEVMGYLQTRARACLNVGIKDVILDLGFGFGKTIAHNYQLLKYLHLYQTQPYPVLVGLSRKSMVYKLLDGTPETALAGSIALHTIALQQQAAILRVHDVKAAIDTIKVLSYYQTL
jgi:dihydropteroate synthase